MYTTKDIETMARQSYIARYAVERTREWTRREDKWGYYVTYTQPDAPDRTLLYGRQYLVIPDNSDSKITLVRMAKPVDPAIRHKAAYLAEEEVEVDAKTLKHNFLYGWHTKKALKKRGLTVYARPEICGRIWTVVPAEGGSPVARGKNIVELLSGACMAGYEYFGLMSGCTEKKVKITDLCDPYSHYFNTEP